ncbi:MAG: hypothetical protein CM1200mP2_56790 [Planctomycetaceae bacterium]|nr:MAG: hypothetical protein CM1200mP2_56790 [Planctomycetaceae bacterium]
MTRWSSGVGNWGGPPWHRSRWRREAAWAVITRSKPSRCGWPAAGCGPAGHRDTNDLGCLPTEDGWHVYDLQATILHALGLDQNG